MLYKLFSGGSEGWLFSGSGVQASHCTGSSAYEEQALQHVGPAVEVPGLQSTGSIVTLQFGTPLQYPCLENPMDRGAWWAAVHGVAESRTRLSD